MNYSASVLVFLCLVCTHLCGRLQRKKASVKRLTPPRPPGTNRLFQAFPRVKLLQPSEFNVNRQGTRKFSQDALRNEAGARARVDSAPDAYLQSRQAFSRKRDLKRIEREAAESEQFMSTMAHRAAAGMIGFAGISGVRKSIDWDSGPDSEPIHVGRAIQHLAAIEGVSPLWDLAVSQKSEKKPSYNSYSYSEGAVATLRYLMSSPAPPAPPPPPPPQEGEGGPSQSLDDELPPPGNWAVADGTFSISTGFAQTVFKFMGDFWFQEGQQSDVARVKREDGMRVIMKRPKYTERDWEDNLQKECFVARILNLVGTSNGVANCIGERTFEPHEVEALKASQAQKPHTKELGNEEKWHAILLEQVDGKSFMNTELSLVKEGREDSDTRAAETKAVEQIIATTAQMLKAGIVNVDQWHNILVSDEGQAKFIDLEGANFLTDAPLQVFLADAGQHFKHEVRQFAGSDGTLVGQWEVRQVPPPEVLKKDEAERKVERMVRNIFGLVPPHAVLAAEETLKSRERLGNSLDGVVDKAWADHKAEMQSKLKVELALAVRNHKVE